ncbi:alpha/beta hydrolase [Aquiflexum gelatinilyticum]|uniref:Alpha/beta hydrolase n=1 Tax=Aquiflexum gelatinilyticum TaxID=2961943 RepID=A0A9X2T084_9BACT|nr:alpha/beta hydrolase [Aquiflexum gelatinilyticum]MCR9015378.1 alpha/beta hydrolase [Aquiflexum gelatinilyticum]
MEFLETTFGHLAYKKHGTGQNIHLLFHGFGQNMKAYDSFLTLRRETDTYLVFDMFYHGQSSWKSVNQKLTKAIWREIVLQLMQKEKFEKFHLVGYSMGGKFCLITYELFPNFVQSLLLMAPDGIKTGFWYNMATFPGILNRLFRHVVFHPERFFRTMDFFHRLGLLQSSLIKFVKSQMGTRKKRAQVYFTWNVFKPLRPDLGLIIKTIRMNQTPISLFTGQFDKMITSDNLSRFNSKIPHLLMFELNSGHNTLIEETFNFLSSKNQIP